MVGSTEDTVAEWGVLSEGNGVEGLLRETQFHSIIHLDWLLLFR